MKKINFCSGPATLPSTVLQKAAEAVIEFNNSGLSILEISHRSNAFQEIIEQATLLIKQLYNLQNSNREVLFLSGGASTQFAMIPYNLLPATRTAAFLNTGTWANRAIAEAKLFGNAHIVASSADQNYTYIPQQYKTQADWAYLHLTTNNTIEGTQIHQFPFEKINCPLIADMSSDIFSKKIDMQKFDVVYAGAQKNLGPAGTTLVILNPDLLVKNNTHRAIPTMLSYDTHLKNKSLYNTPPVFAIYVCYLTLQWIAEQGLDTIQKNNELKSKLLYTEIDRNTMFSGKVNPSDRSHMNVTFVANNPNLESKFLEIAENQYNCTEIRGHRTAGGFRASIYNAMALEQVQVLIKAMQQFENEYGD